MSNYDNETYLRALQASRADAERQVANTLAEIERQRGFNTTQAERVPGATQSAFNIAEQGFNTDLSEINQAAGTQLSLPEIRQAMDTHQTGFRDASGLLRQGFGEQAGQRTGAARNIGQQVYAGIDQQRSEYISRREQEDAQRAWQEQQAAAQRAFAAEQQRLALEAQAREAAANRAQQAALAARNAPPPALQLPEFVPGRDAKGVNPTPWFTWEAFAQHNPELSNFVLWTSGGDMHQAIAAARQNEWMTPLQVSRGVM